MGWSKGHRSFTFKFSPTFFNQCRVESRSRLRNWRETRNRPKKGSPSLFRIIWSHRLQCPRQHLNGPLTKCQWSYGIWVFTTELRIRTLFWTDPDPLLNGSGPFFDWIRTLFWMDPDPFLNGSGPFFEWIRPLFLMDPDPFFNGSGSFFQWIRFLFWMDPVPFLNGSGSNFWRNSKIPKF